MDANRRNSKFGILTFERCSDVQFDGTVELHDGVAAHSACPIDLPEHWQNWLGTLETENLHGANLLFTVQIDSATPTILDDETLQLHKALSALRYGFLLQGIPQYRQSMLVLGAIDGTGEVSVRQFSRPRTAYQHSCARRPQVVFESLARAKQCADAIAALYSDATAYRRLRAGFNACVRGMEEPLPEEQLHQYVRALDGLTMLPPGRGQGLFSERGMTFVTGADAVLVLRQFYQMRNAQEHLNGFQASLPTGTEHKFLRTSSLRVYQAQEVALAAYRHLMSTAALRARFRNEDEIAAFWTLTPDERHAAWGAGTDLDAVQADHDHLYGLLHAPATHRRV